MLDKLQTLEQALNALNKQYHVVATELANLKNKPNNDAKNEAIIADLGQKLNQSHEHAKQLQQKLDDALDNLRQHSENTHHLVQENERLIQENSDLKQKNRLAIERAELIQTWLYNIDHAQNSQ